MTFELREPDTSRFIWTCEKPKPEPGVVVAEAVFPLVELSARAKLEAVDIGQEPKEINLRYDTKGLWLEMIFDADVLPRIIPLCERRVKAIVSLGFTNTSSIEREG